MSKTKISPFLFSPQPSLALPPPFSRITSLLLSQKSIFSPLSPAPSAVPGAAPVTPTSPPPSPRGASSRSAGRALPSAPRGPAGATALRAPPRPRRPAPRPAEGGAGSVRWTETVNTVCSCPLPSSSAASPVRRLRASRRLPGLRREPGPGPQQRHLTELTERHAPASARDPRARAWTGRGAPPGGSPAQPRSSADARPSTARRSTALRSDSLGAPGAEVRRGWAEVRARRRRLQVRVGAASGLGPTARGEARARGPAGAAAARAWAARGAREAVWRRRARRRSVLLARARASSGRPGVACSPVPRRCGGLPALPGGGWCWTCRSDALRVDAVLMSRNGSWESWSLGGNNLFLIAEGRSHKKEKICFLFFGFFCN